jgi:D-alanyl-D-alanine carboxypeptidase
MKKLRLVFLLSLAFIGPSYAQTFDPVLAARLQNTIDSISSANNIKGMSACVIYPGVGTWKGVNGISHPGVPIDSDMGFAIASNTKLFTGVLLLKLVDAGLIQLDDSIHRYLPAYNNIDSNITIRQLLNHTSGLDDVTNVPGYSDSILNDPYRIYTAAELMTWAGPPMFAPGTGWSYCNTNYLLAAMIAESVTGRSYNQLLHNSLLTPLQLDSTFLFVYDSIPYPIAHPWQGGMDFSSTPRVSLNSAAWSAGAMYSTSGEMAQWYQALMGGQVISASSFSEMTTFVGSGNYGIGISEATLNGRTVWQHGGSIWGGYSSSMMYDPATGIVVCVLINQLPAQPYQVSFRLLSAILNNPVSLVDHLTAGNPFILYPNPASDFVNLDLPKEAIRSVRIFDSSGVLVKEVFDIRFSVAELKDGFYSVEVMRDTGKLVFRLVRK